MNAIADKWKPHTVKNCVLCGAGLLGLWLASSVSYAAEPLRLGVLKFGTVNWELSVIKDRKLDEKYGFELEVVPLAAKNATHVAIQGGAVDMIVSDWIWVSRQRSNQRDYTFAPYSTAAGSVMVHPNSGIETLDDLKDKRIGVAGGPVDKSWLLLSAYTRKILGEPVETMTQPSFAAPPLINELMASGEFPSALNYWHYSARLKALGMVELIKVSDLLETLGIEKEIPLIGWVFHTSWAQENPDVIRGFLAASREAQKIMLNDDSVWDFLRPLLKAEDDVIAEFLRDSFREGIIECFDESYGRAIAAAFDIISEIGGRKLVGDSSALAEGTIWPASFDRNCS